MCRTHRSALSEVPTSGLTNHRLWERIGLATEPMALPSARMMARFLPRRRVFVFLVLPPSPTVGHSLNQSQPNSLRPSRQLVFGVRDSGSENPMSTGPPHL